MVTAPCLGVRKHVRNTKFLYLFSREDKRHREETIIVNFWCIDKDITLKILHCFLLLQVNCFQSFFNYSVSSRKETQLHYMFSYFIIQCHILFESKIVISNYFINDFGKGFGKDLFLLNFP